MSLIDEIRKRAQRPCQNEPFLEESLLIPSSPSPGVEACSIGERDKRLCLNADCSPRRQYPETLGNSIENEKIDISGADCEHCLACGTWDYSHYAGKLLCFHRPYFLAKAGNPVICDVARHDCPRNRAKE